MVHPTPVPPVAASQPYRTRHEVSRAKDPAREAGESLRCRVRIDHHLLVAERRAWSVRVATVDDFDALFELVDAVVGEDKWLGAQPPLDRDVTIERWRSDVDDPHAVRFVVEDRGRIVGEANAHLAGGRADLGMQVAEAYRGLGVGTVLVSAIVDWARAQPRRQVDAASVAAQRSRSQPLRAPGVLGGRSAAASLPSKDRRTVGRDRDGPGA